MNTALQAAVANHLNISPNQIKSVEEWASVLFVRFTVGRPRFVSKKVKSMVDDRIPRTLAEARELSGIRFHEWNQEARVLCQEYMNGKFRKDGVVVEANPATSRIRDFANQVDDIRVLPVIAAIAAKLA